MARENGSTANPNTKPERKAPTLLEWVTETTVDPIFLAFAIFILFTRLYPLIEDGPAFTVFWGRLYDDMNGHVVVYGWVTILYLAWVLLKAYRYRLQNRRDKDLTATLERLERSYESFGGASQKTAEAIDRLVDEMRRDREEG